MMSEEQKDFLDLILPLNIEARYPTQNIVQNREEILNYENIYFTFK